MLNFVSTTMAGSLGNLHMDYAFGLKQKFPTKISENFHKKQPQFFKCSLSLLVLNLRVSQVIVFHLQNWIINMGSPVVALCNKKNWMATVILAIWGLGSNSSPRLLLWNDLGNKYLICKRHAKTTKSLLPDPKAKSCTLKVVQDFDGSGLVCIY